MSDWRQNSLKPSDFPTPMIKQGNMILIKPPEIQQPRAPSPKILNYEPILPDFKTLTKTSASTNNPDEKSPKKVTQNISSNSYDQIIAVSRPSERKKRVPAGVPSSRLDDWKDWDGLTSRERHNRENRRKRALESSIQPIGTTYANTSKKSSEGLLGQSPPAESKLPKYIFKHHPKKHIICENHTFQSEVVTMLKNSYMEQSFPKAFIARQKMVRIFMSNSSTSYNTKNLFWPSNLPDELNLAKQLEDREKEVVCLTKNENTYSSVFSVADAGATFDQNQQVAPSSIKRRKARNITSSSDVNNDQIENCGWVRMDSKESNANDVIDLTEDNDDENDEKSANITTPSPKSLPRPTNNPDDEVLEVNSTWSNFESKTSDSGVSVESTKNSYNPSITTSTRNENNQNSQAPIPWHTIPRHCNTSISEVYSMFINPTILYLWCPHLFSKSRPITSRNIIFPKDLDKHILIGCLRYMHGYIYDERINKTVDKYSRYLCAVYFGLDELIRKFEEEIDGDCFDIALKGHGLPKPVCVGDDRLIDLREELL